MPTHRLGPDTPHAPYFSDCVTVLMLVLQDALPIDTDIVAWNFQSH